MRYSIGKYVSNKTRNGAWGTGAIQAICDQLHGELPGLRGFSPSAVKRMRSFYEQWKVLENRPLIEGENKDDKDEVKKIVPSEEELRRVIDEEI